MGYQIFYIFVILSSTAVKNKPSSPLPAEIAHFPY